LKPPLLCPHFDASVRVGRKELPAVRIRQRRVELAALVRERVRRQGRLEVAAAQASQALEGDPQAKSSSLLSSHLTIRCSVPPTALEITTE